MIDSEVEAAIKKLGPKVVRVRLKVGVNWSDEHCITFRIVITDAASRKAVLGDVPARVHQILKDELFPIENRGLRPYCQFRKQSEQGATRPGNRNPGSRP